MTSQAVPDVPQTFLAFRTWTLDKARMQLGSTTPAGGYRAKGKAAKELWMANALGVNLGAWPKDGECLTAKCTARSDFEDDDAYEAAHLYAGDGRVASPGPECKGSGGHGCGIYATTDLGVINTYLSRTAPVMGVVELGGRVLECPQGYRAEFVRVAAILLIDEVLTKPLSQDMLRKVAKAYGVPALVPTSTRPEDYREAIENSSEVTNDVDAELRELTGR
jgi:hypothetical protein